MSTIKIVSMDAETFEVDLGVAKKSVMLQNMIDDIDVSTDVIPLPNVSSKILAKIIEFCKYHTDASADPETYTVNVIKTWQTEFITVDQQTLFDLMLAANYLDIKSLLDLTCQTVAGLIKGKSPEELRAIFNIKCDFTPEEEEEIRRENQWAFE